MGVQEMPAQYYFGGVDNATTKQLIKFFYIKKGKLNEFTMWTPR